MSIETLDYIINFNDHTVTCFEVGSVPTIGYASIEDAMTGTNPIIVPECIFEAACALLDQGVHLTAIYAHVGEETWMQWDEIPEELTAEDIVAIEGEESIRKQAVNRKQRRAVRIERNKSHKGADRFHGKKRMPSAKFVREADNHQQDIYHAHAKYVWHENRKGEWIPRTVRKHDKFRQERFMRSAEITEVERLTASVLAHMSNHVFMWDEQVVYDLTEAICEEYKQPYPDDSYITKDGVGIVHLTFQVERFEPGYGSYVEETDYRLN